MSAGGNGAADGFDNEFLEGSLVADNGGRSASLTPKRLASSAMTTPSYPDLAKKAFGSRGQTVVKIGIAASEYLDLVRWANFFSTLRRL